MLSLSARFINIYLFFMGVGYPVNSGQWSVTAVALPLIHSLIVRRGKDFLRNQRRRRSVLFQAPNVVPEEPGT
jgi:hypothetical protein